jgi:hypothetical protein
VFLDRKGKLASAICNDFIAAKDVQSKMEIFIWKALCLPGAISGVVFLVVRVLVDIGTALGCGIEFISLVSLWMIGQDTTHAIHHHHTAAQIFREKRAQIFWLRGRDDPLDKNLKDTLKCRSCAFDVLLRRILILRVSFGCPAHCSDSHMMIAPPSLCPWVCPLTVELSDKWPHVFCWGATASDPDSDWDESSWLDWLIDSWLINAGIPEFQAIAIGFAKVLTNGIKLHALNTIHIHRISMGNLWNLQVSFMHFQSETLD